MSTTSIDARPADGWPEQQGPCRLAMTGDAGSLRDARHSVDEALRGIPEQALAGAVLVAGEVLTNAVVHGGGRCLLHLDVNARRMRVEVTDTGSRRPHEPVTGHAPRAHAATVTP